MSDYEVYLYRCADCGIVSATTVRVTPPTHQAVCVVCCYPRTDKRSTLHHAIFLDIDPTLDTMAFRLKDWRP